ncbi:unnamed protein product [Caenorhabditis nigoni]
MPRYIVIELPEQDNGSDVINFLMTRPKSKFTITDDISEYAAEREEIRRARSTENARFVHREATAKMMKQSESPAKKLCLEDSRKRDKQNEEDSLETSSSFPSNDFQNIVPKTEDVDNFQTDMSKDWDTIQPAAQPPLPYSTISELMKTSAMFNGSNTEKPSRRRQNETFKCHVCESYIKAYNFDYYKRSNHAIIHTGLQRYICPVEGCGAKTRHRSNMVVHARTAHGLTGKIEVENCLLPHEEDELKRTVILCFPEMTNTVLAMQRKERGKMEEGFVESDDDFVEETAYENK